VIVLYGGGGFLGRHLAAHLAGRRAATLVTRRDDPAFVRDWAPGTAVMSPEAFDGPAGEALIASATAVLWLAGTAAPSSNADQPWRELEQNIEPLWRGLERITRINPLVRIVFPSSGGTVYGHGHLRPIVETCALRPVSPYGVSKVLAEQVVRWTAERVGADYAILRIANPIGRWQMNPNQGIATLALQALLRDEPLTLYDRGRQVRDFFDADDLARLFVRVIDVPGRLRGIWNAGSGRGLSVAELVDMVAERSGRRLKLRHAPARPEDVDYAVVNPARATRRFDWRVTTSLDETIGKIVGNAKA
jgi:UDP-glucose 4-epimerase